MKRSARRLIGAAASMFGTERCTIEGFHLCLNEWIVRHLTVRLGSEERVTVRATDASFSRSSDLRVRLLGRYDRRSAISIGESPMASEVRARELLDYQIVTIDQSRYSVTDLAIDDIDWAVTYIIVDGGAGRRAAVPPPRITWINRDCRLLQVKSDAGSFHRSFFS